MNNLPQPFTIDQYNAWLLVEEAKAVLQGLVANGVRTRTPCLSISPTQPNETTNSVYITFSYTPVLFTDRPGSFGSVGRMEYDSELTVTDILSRLDHSDALFDASYAELNVSVEAN